MRIINVIVSYFNKKRIQISNIYFVFLKTQGYLTLFSPLSLKHMFHRIYFTKKKFGFPLKI